MDADLAGHSVLLVGGAGYVGSVLATRLLGAGARVRVLDQLVYDNGFAVHNVLDRDGLTLVRGDLRDRTAVVRALGDAEDVVLLAALVGDPICAKYPELAWKVNADGAIGLVDVLEELGVRRLVFTSTCSNYGIHDPDRLADEDSEVNPQSLYARSKIAVERHLLGRAATLRAAATILRIATAYGMSPRMRFDLTVSHFTHELASGAELLVYDADTWRPYCHVRDIAKAIMAVLTAPDDAVRGEVFNVGDNNQQFRKRMIVDEVCKHLTSARVVYRDGDTDPRNYRASFDKIAYRLGFRIENSVQAYIAALVAAVHAGVFADVPGNPRYGNYEVRHLE
jgi:nucleoside-diphosphate-sugar epimerase